jgi:hypothetical protein
MQHRSLLALRLACVVAFVCASSVSVQAHTLWTMPRPRDQQDGYKPPPRDPGFVLPCGVARGAAQPVTTLRAGAAQMVQWDETISHPGCFLIEFARSDSEPFQNLLTYPHPNTPGRRQYQAMINLPAQPCTGCILRIRQVMLGTNSETCPPANMRDLDPYLYYSCANIILTADPGGASDAGTGGTGGSYPATGGAAGNPAAAPSDGSGGFCSLGGREQKPAFALLLAAVLFGLARRPRRR